MKIPNDLIYKPLPEGDIKDTAQYLASREQNWKNLQMLDEEARQRGLLVGRYITHAFADGQAVYQIVAENRKTIRIQVVRGLGDDWVLPAWGVEATIDKVYAEKEFRSREFLRKQEALPGAKAS